VTELHRAVAAASWSDLLPAHRTDGDDQPVGAPTCIDTLPLARGRWLAVVADSRGRTYPVPVVAHGGRVRRARPGDGAAEALVAMLAEGRKDLGGFALTCWHTEPCAGELAIEVDQTNESVVVGDRAVLKWTFLAAEGPHPAPILLAELARRHFTGTPQPWGLVTWRPSPDAAPRPVASVVSLLPGGIDGWTWAVDDLRQAVTSDDDAVVVASGDRLGELVADFHSALAATVERAPADAVRRWRSDADAEFEQALEVTTGAAHELLVTHADSVRGAWDDLGEHSGTPIMRVHGDLHVGQVLRAGRGAARRYVVTDFDGSPVVRPAERMSLQPAVVDVAGMAQSISHAALVLRRHEPELSPDAARRASAAFVSTFLSSYRRSLQRAGHGDLLEPALVRPYRLRQVCREFTYAATHLPRWSYVPEAALPALIGESA
jgi:maltokinase